jgi:hypothetical protein
MAWSCLRGRRGSARQARGPGGGLSGSGASPGAEANTAARAGGDRDLAMTRDCDDHDGGHGPFMVTVLQVHRGRPSRRRDCH